MRYIDNSPTDINCRTSQLVLDIRSAKVTSFEYSKPNEILCRICSNLFRVCEKLTYNIKFQMFPKYISFGIWSIWSLQILVGKVRCEFSGFYVDNGIGQTVMEESIPRADTQLMRHHILELLDLPDRPDTERFPSVIRLVLNEFSLEFVCTASEIDSK